MYNDNGKSGPLEKSPGEQVEAEIKKKMELLQVEGLQSLMNDRDGLRRQCQAFNEKQERWIRRGEELKKQYELAANEHTSAKAEYETAQGKGDKIAMDRVLGRISAASKKVESLKAEFKKHNSDSTGTELAEESRRFNVAQCALAEKVKDIQWVLSMLNPGVSCDLQQFNREYDQNRRFIENL